MYTVTNQLSAGNKGSFPVAPPASQPFPLPYSEDFSAPGGGQGTNNTLIPKYISDQYGVFELHAGILPSAAAPAGGPAGRGSVGGSNQALVQVLPQGPGANGWAHASNPATIVGGLNATTWSDYSIGVDAFLPDASPVSESEMRASIGSLRSSGRRASRSASAASRAHAAAARRSLGVRTPGGYLESHPHLEGLHAESTRSSSQAEVKHSWNSQRLADYATPYADSVSTSASALDSVASKEARGMGMGAAYTQTDAILAPCAGSSSAPPAYQTWMNGTQDGPLYLRNKATSTCLNSDGCLAPVITYSCITQGPTCCGADCYKGL